MESVRNPSLAGVVRAAMDRRLAEVCTVKVARVERVDLDQGLIDAQPLVKSYTQGADGEDLVEREAVVTNVPLLSFGGAGVRFNPGAAVGDLVTLLFCDRSIDKWKSYGGEQDPGIQHTHHRADALALPGVHYFGAPWSGGPSIGHDQGPQVFFSQLAIALGDKNATDGAIKGTTYRSAEDTMLTSLSVALTAVAAAITSVAAIGTGGAAAGTACTNAVAAITNFQASAANYLSTKVKVA